MGNPGWHRGPGPFAFSTAIAVVNGVVGGAVRIKVALGGRAAEKVVFGDVTTGAESEIQNLTQMARSMVGRWGMSDAIGAITVTDGRQDGFLLPGTTPASASTQQLVDEEVRRIVDTAEEDVIELLRRERSRLEALARALLEHETLD